MSGRKTLLALGVMVLVSAASAFAAPPNIIFILVDDMGYGDVGAYFQNDRQAKNDRSLPWTSTPNLDKFAIDGAQFFDHYCAAALFALRRARPILLGVTYATPMCATINLDKRALKIITPWRPF